MPKEMLRFAAVDSAYESSPILLFEQLDLTFAPGWTGVVGANGTG